MKVSSGSCSPHFLVAQAQPGHHTSVWVKRGRAVCGREAVAPGRMQEEVSRYRRKTGCGSWGRCGVSSTFSRNLTGECCAQVPI